MTISKKNILTVALHSLLWFAFLSLPTPFDPFSEKLGLEPLLSDILRPNRAANAILFILLFYFNYRWAIPKIYFRRNYLMFAISVLISFNIFFLLNYLVVPPPRGFHTSHGHSILGHTFNLFMFIIVYVFSFALCFYEQLKSVREQVLEAELAFLRAQVSPHFLFNTLNSIYSLTLSKSDDAPEAIVKLSSLMRYALSDSIHEKVSLQDELDYISSYIDLQKMRLTSKIRISFEQQGEVGGKQIAPFLLIPFIENAFKYGVNSESNSDIKISIIVDATYILLGVTNNKVYLRLDREKSSGMGISTTRKRLGLLYPGKHELEISDRENEFGVHLKIELNDHSYSDRR